MLKGQWKNYHESRQHCTHIASSHGDDNDGWLTARQSKVPRVESPSTVDGSEEGTSDRERGTPPDILSWTSKGRKTKSHTRST